MKKKKESKLNKMIRENKTILFIAFFFVFLGVGVLATTTITENLITSPSGTYTNLSADSINSVLYVDAGNGSDIQATIDKCPAVGCEVVIPNGEYNMSDVVTLVSNLKLTIKEGAEIVVHADSDGSGFYNWTDIQSVSHIYMFHGESIENVKIYNYGELNARKYNAVGFGIKFFDFDDCQNIYLYGGIVKDTSGLLNLRDTDYATVENVIASDISSDIISAGCSDYVTIDNIQHTGYGSSETIDINEYGNYISISNVLRYGGKGTNQEVLDINGASYVTLNNIVGNNASRVLTYTNFSGERIGTCTQNGHTLMGQGLTCYDCDSLATANSHDYYFEVMNDEGTKTVYTDTDHNDASAIINMIGKYGNTEFNGHVIQFSRDGANIFRANDTSGSLYFQTGGSNNRMVLPSSGGAIFGSTSRDTNSSFSFRSQEYNNTILDIFPKDDVNGQNATEIRLHGDKDANLNRYVYMREINDETVDKNSMILGVSGGDAIKINYDKEVEVYENLTINSLSGTGNACACIDSTGKLYRNETAGCTCN